MAQEKIIGFYEENTVEIIIAGKKCRVNKYEAEALKAKLDKNTKSKK